MTYWTGWLSPEMEGCSKEVFALKAHFQGRVFGLSASYLLRVSTHQRSIGLGMRLYPLFRVIAPLWDRGSDVNHIYGGLAEWFFLRTLRRNPIVMTIAVETPALDAVMYRHVRCFVTHSTATAAQLAAYGIGADRVRLIYPGLDLRRFRPAPRDAAPMPLASWSHLDPSRFRILFATTPDREDGVETRGVNLLIEAARRLPDVDFLVPWRPWAGADRVVAACLAQAPPNVHISMELVPDMTRLFQAVDATIAPFQRRESMKLCPTSLVESLACGRPLVVSTPVGISDLVEREGCGTRFDVPAEASAAAGPGAVQLCDAIERLRRDYPAFAARSRPAAERHFDQAHCFDAHARLYQEVLAHRAEAA